MAPKSKGRLDWKPRLNVWRVILYRGLRDVSAGDYPTYEEAAAALQEGIERNRA